MPFFEKFLNISSFFEICAEVRKITSYLLSRQIKRLEEDFIKEGGLREKMTKARINYRNKGQ